MMKTGHQIANRLRNCAIAAIENGHAVGCTVQLGVMTDGRLVAAFPSNSGRHAMQLVSWPDAITCDGAVSAAIDMVAAQVAWKAR